MVKYPEKMDAAIRLMELWCDIEENLKNVAEELGYYNNDEIEKILVNENYHTLARVLDF